LSLATKTTFAGCEVVSVRIDEIRPYDKNPRKNDTAVQAVANSIKQFGFRQPIVVDKHGVIIVGHTRYKAAKLLGMTEVPVVYADMKPSDAKAYRLADNKTGELAEWDAAKLEEELSQCLLDMEEFGFDPNDEISNTIPVSQVDPQYPADTVFALVVAPISVYAEVDKALNSLPDTVKVIIHAQSRQQQHGG